MSITHREARYIQERLAGKSAYEAARAAGFSHWLAKVPGQWIEKGEVKAEIERLQAELVQHTLDVGLIDAAEIHDYLTEAIRADMRDIRNEDGSYKPQSEWPPIWGRMMEAGDCEIEYESVRSYDGEDTEGRGGWETGGVVRKVKLKFSSRAKLLELAMRHKGVNAMAEQKQGDINIVVVTAEKARQVAAAKKRLAKVIDIKPEE